VSNIFTNCGIITPRVFEVLNFTQPSIQNSHIPYFHNLICNWALNVAQQYSWVVVIDAQNKQFLLNKIKNTVPNLEPTGWNTQDAINTTWTEQTQDVIGCIFAQAVNIPGEEIKIEYAGVSEGSSRGCINAPIVAGRNNFAPLQISFLETNKSFVDGVLRPWNVLVGHEGLIAKPQGSSIKSNISVYQLAKAGHDTPLAIRKKWTYYDCVPSQIVNEDLSYASSTDYGKRQVFFTYNYYTLQA
jgi:hypothetical protein